MFTVDHRLALRFLVLHDQKALDLMRQARAAIGGEAALAEIRDVQVGLFEVVRQLEGEERPEPVGRRAATAVQRA